MNKLSSIGLVIISLAMSFSSFGCALSTTKIPVNTPELNPVTTRRSGAIAVKVFVDARPQDTKDRQFIGYKRNGFGTPIGRLGIEGDTSVEDVVSRLIADTLTKAGYTVQILPAGTPGSAHRAIITGQIREFWVDMYMNVWAKVDFYITLQDSTGQTLWEKDFAGGSNYVLWWGAPGEFQEALDDGVTDVLDRALLEFSSEEFQQKVSQAAQ